jgi:hypothetical protein
VAGGCFKVGVSVNIKVQNALVFLVFGVVKISFPKEEGIGS